jgi:hypothetical protein
MPGRKRKPQEDGTTLDFATLTVQDAPEDAVFRQTRREPSPLQDAFDSSFAAMTDGAEKGSNKELTVDTEAIARQVDSQIRRAANFRNTGSQITHQPTEDGRVRVLFAAKTPKKARPYTAKQVRTWASEQDGLEVPETGRLPKETVNAYRVAHGLKATA